MRITIDHSAKTPVYLQIKQAILAAIRDGKLVPGARLLATRELAQQLGVNRSTVAMAYDELLADGVVESFVGRGTFVARQTLAEVTALEGRASRQPPNRKMVWEGVFSERAQSPVVESLLDLYQVSTLRDVISFSGSFPDAGSFPTRDFRNSLHFAERTLGDEVYRYGPVAGYERLREYLAQRMREGGSDVTAENIIVTSGSQQALDLIARALISPGDTVAIENPTYPGAMTAFALAGARLLPIPVDEDGLCVEVLENVLRVQRPKLVYVVPSFQNPTGACLSWERRRRLLALAREHNLPIVEDDYGSHLRFDGDALPHLKALDDTEHVIYVSNFSKSLLPGLRIGWCAAARPVITRLMAFKQNSDITTSPLLQSALWDFCRRKRYDAHLQKIRPIYHARRDVMLKRLEADFPSGTVWTRPAGGLFLWVTLPTALDATELLYQVRQQGVVFSRGRLFYSDNPKRNTLRLSYGHVTLEQIERGMRVIGTTAKAMLGRGASRAAERFHTQTVPLV
ncbi:MAG: PLP-dependent aminotransferase family protein [Chloracidobacterium sp.]|uniref:PLP-dependent aminotransferase family protein n=1 Tax=Chloracidobacterium validum TaxID=2821543 RepID=A0ABX8B983_9BACT|nr:PLP-dependent aminotransferase family protein [Chloracidobacterium validum]QUW02616.1 PLP-dependent aminotransferase family protein [Chloracidobacterium validum]